MNCRTDMERGTDGSLNIVQHIGTSPLSQVTGENEFMITSDDVAWHLEKKYCAL